MINRKVKIDDTIYQVIDECRKEVAVLQLFEYADGLHRQSLIWTDNYEEIIEDN